MTMTFEDAVDYLDNLQLHKIKLGLDSMRSFLQSVGNPQDSLRFVHVAGTNGKGSVCSSLVSISRHGGYQVGLYTSPHLNDVRERFSINDQYISESEFTEIIATIQKALAGAKITYFECTTAIALLWFEKKQPDFVVLETGLGGRLDATNVVTPMFSIITNISLDHEAYLGDSIESVASEKAGIIKPSVPLISGATQPSVIQIIEDVCRKHKSPMFQLGKDFTITHNSDGIFGWDGGAGEINGTYSSLTSSLKGAHQAQNMSLVLAALPLLREHGIQLTEKNVRAGLLQVIWPGRLEQVDVCRTQNGAEVNINYLLDGGHNPAGIASLVNTLKEDYADRKILVVWGAMSDKDSGKTLPCLAPLVDKIFITKPESERSAEPNKIFRQLNQDVQTKCEMVSNVESALTKAEKVANDEMLIVVAGSLYLVGAVRFLLLGSLVEQ